MREINVNNCEVIGRGGQGTIYRLDEETIVKLYNPGYSLEAIEKERAASRAALKLGIPTAFSFGTVQCGDRYGVVFEMMNSGTLSQAIKANPEKMPQYVKLYCDLFKELHTIHDVDGIYPKLKGALHAQADRLVRWGLSAEEIATAHELVDAIPDADTIIHGDFHPGNLMLHNDELLIIDVPDLKSGSPLYDLYTVFRDMITCPKNVPEQCEISQGMPPELCLTVGQMFFSMYYESRDPQVLGQRMQSLGLVSALFSTLFTGEEHLHPETEKHAPGTIERAFRGVVLPNAQTVKHLLAHL